MNRQNPGGEVVTKPTMKGCEFGMKKGKGSDVGGTLQTKYSMNAPGMNGWRPAGAVLPRSTDHAKSSVSATVKAASHKATK